MGIEKDIQSLFAGVLEKYGGNKAAAAESLGVNPVTFWHWVTKTRKLPSTLCKAIDNAGGSLLFPGESPPSSLDNERELEVLRREIAFLTRENELLTRLVDKYTADEREKNEAPQEAGRKGRPASTADIGVGRPA